MARWLAARVGATGPVLCTDIDTRIIESYRGNTPANLEVQRHDIANDPLPEAGFDLVHARLVLIHVPSASARWSAWSRRSSPAAGWSSRISTRLRSSRTPASIALKRRYAPSDAVRIYLTRAQDGYFGRRLHGSFRELGLTQVYAEGRMVMFDRDNGGTNSCA